MEKKEELEKRRKVVPHAVRRQQKRDRTRERAEENGKEEEKFNNVLLSRESTVQQSRE